MNRERQDSFTVATAVFALLALVAAIFAVGLSSRDGTGTTVAAAGEPAGGTASVTLTEFKIEPDSLSVAAGSKLAVTNAGSVAHNLAIKDTDLRTADLNGGASETLDLAALKPGTYTLFCAVPGHEAAGMKGTLTVTTGGGAAASDGHDMASSSKAMTAEEMDAAMRARTLAFPQETAGKGGELLAPTVLPDGTKQFDLTAKIVDWEVEKGKTVKAWTYNGVVPGPTIKVNVGDKVRVVVKNELPESTAVHFHGVKTPNSMDGVPDITQDPIKPGGTFTYEFTARETAVGMYHSHHDAQVQVPNGLAGAFLIGDVPVPAGLGTPTQVKTMMLNDAGTIGFAINGKSFPATEPIVAKPGEWVEIHYLNEGLMAHPMHLHGLDQIVIAKDGFPLAQPQKADTVVVAPGERYTVLVHATEPGVWAFHCHILTHAEAPDGMFGMVTAMIVK